MHTVVAACLFFLWASVAAALPNSGSTGGTTTPPPPPADPYVLVLVFNGGDPAAVIVTDSTGGLPTRYTTLQACTDAGNVWLKPGSNPSQTVLKFNCIQVKPVGSALNYLLDGQGNKLLTAVNGDKLLAR